MECLPNGSFFSSISHLQPREGELSFHGRAVLVTFAQKCWIQKELDWVLIPAPLAHFRFHPRKGEICGVSHRPSLSVGIQKQENLCLASIVSCQVLFMTLCDAQTLSRAWNRVGNLTDTPDMSWGRASQTFQHVLSLCSLPVKVRGNGKAFLVVIWTTHVPKLRSRLLSGWRKRCRGLKTNEQRPADASLCSEGTGGGHNLTWIGFLQMPCET